MAQRIRKGRRSLVPPSPSISISFTPQELQFLVQALRDLPLRGTPDSLTQALPMIQNVRLKFASALQVTTGGAPPEEPIPIQQPPEKDTASNESAPPAE